MAVGPNGHIFLTGATNGSTDFGCASDAGVLSLDAGAAYLVELDGSGACQWLALFGNPGTQGTGVAVDPTTSNIVLTVSFTGKVPSGGTTVPGSVKLAGSSIDSFVAAYSPDHIALWYHQIGDHSGFGVGDQMVTSVAVNDHLVAAGGYYYGTLAVVDQPSFHSVGVPCNGKDAFVYVFNMANGSYSEDVEITSPDPSDQTVAGTALHTDGTCAVAGTTTGTTDFVGNTVNGTVGDANILLGTYAIGKNPLIQSVLGDSAPQNGRSVAFDGAGNVLLGASIQGNVPVLGAAFSSPGGQSVLLVPFQDQIHGSARGGIVFGSSSASDVATLAGMAPDSNGNVFVAGSFTGTSSFTGGTPVTSVGAADVYVARLDGTLKNVAWLDRYGDAADQGVDAIAVDPSSGDVLVAGHFQGQLAFGPSASLTNASGMDRLFVAKLKP
jgi:hypothetical protein